MEQGKDCLPICKPPRRSFRCLDNSTAKGEPVWFEEAVDLVDGLETFDWFETEWSRLDTVSSLRVEEQVGSM